jgi:hypothetical protein
MNWSEISLGGHPVRIYAEDGSAPANIHGAIYLDNEWTMAVWDAEGVSCNLSLTEYNLVPAADEIRIVDHPDMAPAEPEDSSLKDHLYNVLWVNYTVIQDQIDKYDEAGKKTMSLSALSSVNDANLITGKALIDFILVNLAPPPLFDRFKFSNN